MTDRQAIEPFETRFARRVRAYTEPATERRIDALAIARSAMSPHRAAGWSQRGLGAEGLGRRFAGVRWAVASVAIVLIGVVGIAVVGRSSDSGIGPRPTSATPSTPATSSTPGPTASAGGPIPDVLRHSWQRPYPVTPGQDSWGTGFLILAGGRIDFGIEPGPAASASSVTAGGPDTIVAAATVETRGCAIGAIGTYRWSLEGKDTVMTLIAIGADTCPAREEALAGQWVRSDFPPPVGGEAALVPGTHLTSAFDPFGMPGLSGQVSYTVPGGWRVVEDRPAVLTLHRPPAASGNLASTDVFVFLLADPRIASDVVDGASCGPSSVAPGVGHAVDEVVAMIIARPGVVAAQPAAVTIGGFEGQILDLTLDPDWTRGCLAPEGPIVGVPILAAVPGGGPSFGVGSDRPMRLILLDLTGGHTMAVAIGCVDPNQPCAFDKQVAAVMPIIESFEFHPGVP